MQVVIDISPYATVLQERIDDLLDWSSRRSDPLSREDGKRTFDKLMAESKAHLEAVADKMAQAAASVMWRGSKIVVKPSFNSDPMEFDFERGVRAAFVHVMQGRDDASFAYFGDTIDDVLEAGDTDFFRNLELDYFALIEELRHPGRAEREGEKVLRLYTARPRKDRAVYDTVNELPSRIFLTSDPDDVEGIAADMGGRDIYEVRIKAKYVMPTLDVGRVKHYQTIVTPSGKVPVERVSQVG
jgi:hypothetical protein